MARTGWFECSDPMVTQLHENVVWGMRGNFLYLPTDCPQRDERLGWTGDIQVFSPTASYLFDCDGFLSSWLVDLQLEQKAGGGVPFIVPDVLHSAKMPAAAWGDVATILPMNLYERFGDVGVLEAQYDSAKAWVDQLLGIAGERYLWEDGFQFGDWVDPDAPPDQPAKAKSDPDLVASAYLFRSAETFSRHALVLGRTEDAAHYATIAEKVRQAWLAEYATPAGRIMSDAQTSYAVAIAFNIATGALRDAMGKRLAWLVRRDGYRIGTGFVGTPIIADALSSTGNVRQAGRMLQRTECPSWLYPITMGATTIWERWDSMLEDGSINPGEMTSFNHYALGAIADWLHRVVAGLAPAEAGYRSLEIAPQFLPGLEWASTKHETPYGTASVAWRRAGGRGRGRRDSAGEQLRGGQAPGPGAVHGHRGNAPLDGHGLGGANPWPRHGGHPAGDDHGRPRGVRSRHGSLPEGQPGAGQGVLEADRLAAQRAAHRRLHADHPGGSRGDREGSRRAQRVARGGDRLTV